MRQDWIFKTNQMHTHNHIILYTHTHTYTESQSHMHKHTHMHMHMHAHAHTHKQTNTYKQTHRHTMHTSHITSKWGMHSVATKCTAFVYVDMYKGRTYIPVNQHICNTS